MGALFLIMGFLCRVRMCVVTFYVGRFVCRYNRSELRLAGPTSTKVPGKRTLEYRRQATGG
jgi:hypothetical protein